MKIVSQESFIAPLAVHISAVAIFCSLSFWLVSQVSADDKPDQLLKLINGYRQSKGLSELKLHSKLSLAATRHSDDMVRKNYFSHCDPENQCLKWRLQKVGYRPRIWAETLAAGLQDPKKVLEKWIDSLKHNKILLNRDVVHAGIGYNQGSIKDMTGIWTLVVSAPF